MKSKQTYEKAAKISAKYVKIETAVKNCNGNKEMIAIVQKIFSRAKNEPEISVKQFCDDLIKLRLWKIAKAMPDEGYSMGSNIRILCGKCEANDDRTDTYSKSCKYRPTHGGYFHRFTPRDLRNIRVIGGLVTYIYPNQRGKVKKCWWYSGEGKKQHWRLTKVEGFICGDYHATRKENAKAGFERNEITRKIIAKAQLLAKKTEAQKAKLFAKALRRQYSYQDSIAAGNCENGTKAFAMRLQIDINKKYRGKYLLDLAKEKSTSSVYYVERMIKSKM
jgi:hypothetical protein